MGCDSVIFAGDRSEGNTGVGCGSDEETVGADRSRSGRADYVEGVWRSVTV